MPGTTAHLRLWDAEADPVAEKDGDSNSTAVFLPDGRLLTGSMWKRDGWLQGWACPPGQAPQADKQRTAAFPPQENLRSFPRLDAVLRQARRPARSRRGGPAKVPGRTAPVEHRGPAPGRFGTVRADVALWTGATLATVAAAPGTEYLAVAGSPDHTIRVYGIKDLLGGGTRPQQVLRGTGTVIRAVAFALRDKERGLLLREAAGDQPLPPPGDLLFDFSKGRLTGNTQGWKRDAPAPGAWRASPALASRTGPCQRPSSCARGSKRRHAFA